MTAPCALLAIALSFTAGVPATSQDADMRMTLLEKFEFLKDKSATTVTHYDQGIDACIHALRNHHFWFPIDEAPVKIQIIAWAPGWASPCEVVLDENRVAYQAGSDCIPHPQPTDYQLMPEPPRDGS